MTPDIQPDLSQVQGNILRGYRKPLVRHLVLRIGDPVAARRWLLDATSGDETLAPQITRAEWGDDRPTVCVNVGITHHGLRRPRCPPGLARQFPARVRRRHGITLAQARRHRAERPVHVETRVAGPHERPPDGDDPRRRRRRSRRTLPIGCSLPDPVGPFPNWRDSTVPGSPTGFVHFGYKDSISQPHFRGIRDPEDRPDRQPLAEIGAALLGYKTPVENLRWEVPQPDVLGLDGSFNAFRVLEQRVEEFESFLTDSADVILANPLADEVLPPGVEATWDPPVTRHEAMRELVAAKILGRWRNGVPLMLSPTTPTPNPPVGIEQLNDYGYGDDPDGTTCPIGSHMRRCNPRDARIVQRKTNHARRIIRRGIPYGEPFDPQHPDGEETRPARPVHLRQPDRAVRGDPVRLDEPRPAGPPTDGNE